MSPAGYRTKPRKGSWEAVHTHLIVMTIKCPPVQGSSLNEQEFFFRDLDLSEFSALNPSDNHQEELQIIAVIQLMKAVKDARKSRLDEDLASKFQAINSQIKIWQNEACQRMVKRGRIAVNSPIPAAPGVYAARLDGEADILVRVLEKPEVVDMMHWLGSYVYQQTYYLQGYAGFSKIHYDNHQIELIQKIDSFDGLDPLVYGGWQMEELIKA